MKLWAKGIESHLCTKGEFKGYLVTFISLGKCNLDCRGCKAGKGKLTSVEKVLVEVSKLGNERVVICGGEPHLQPNSIAMLYDLVTRGYKVVVETNGSFELEFSECRSFHVSLNLRTPSTQVESLNVLDNLTELIHGDELRFTIKDIHDYEYAKSIISKYHTKATITFTSDEELAPLVIDWMKEDKLSRVRFDLLIKVEEEV